MRLSLDLGTNSIGWMLFELNSKGEPEGIVKSGVRIFPSGRNPKSYTSLNEDRRGARSARRRRDRYLQRRKHLMQAMIKHGLMPKEEAERKALEKLNPFELRALAVEKELPPYHVGRALFHLNQRRGFNSNRKNKDKDKESKIVGESIKQFKEELNKRGSKTLGAYLWSLNKDGKPVRARREGTTQKDLYDMYPDRSMLKYEFDSIWKKQSETQSRVFTNRAKKEIYDVIFTQRPLKPQVVGKCTYLPDEDRAPFASPIFQAFRIRKTLNDLEIRIGYEELYCFNDLERKTQDVISDKLFKQKKVGFDALRTILKKAGFEGDIRFNLETSRRKELEGDAVGAELSKKDLCGDQWFKWPLKKQRDFVYCLLDDADTETIEDSVKKLREDFGLGENNAKECMEISFPDGHARLSEKAMQEMLPFLEKGENEYSAAENAGLSVGPRQKDGESDELPPYERVIEHYTVARKPGEDPGKQDFRITNPTVHIALNQLRKVVNDIIRIYGKPEQIHLELARQLPLGKEAKADLEKFQKENQEKREEACKLLKEHGQTVNRDNVERVLIWKELSENINHRCCVYTGKPIGIEKLFSPEIEIEHILPFSRTLDDSRANKILSYREANRYKGDKTPEEAFNNEQARQDGYDWEKIFNRAEKLPLNKLKRFNRNALENFLLDSDFLERQLTDTSYIGKAAKEYLTAICPTDKIVVIPGRLTAWLRKAWELNDVLGKKGEKNREDHRHHAVDAAVVGVTSRSTLQKIATAVQEHEGELEDEWLKRDYVKEPWKNFRRDVEESINKIVVSHKPDRKASGQLHNETAYGIIGDFNPGAPTKVFHHVPLTELKNYKYLDKVVNEKLRAKLKDLFSDGGEVLKGAEFKNTLSRFGKSKKIRRVRIEEPLTVIPIYKDGKPYKYFKTDSNFAYDIFCTKGKKKWEGEIISLFDAKQPGFIPHWRKKEPDAQKIMRIHVNDMLKLNIDGTEKIVRVQRISEGVITLAEHNEANVDQRDRNKEFKFAYKTPSTLQKSEARKIHVSPSGLVYDPGPFTTQE